MVSLKVDIGPTRLRIKVSGLKGLLILTLRAASVFPFIGRAVAGAFDQHRSKKGKYSFLGHTHLVCLTLTTNLIGIASRIVI